jgi:hypothetical protein
MTEYDNSKYVEEKCTSSEEEKESKTHSAFRRFREEVDKAIAENRSLKSIPIAGTISIDIETQADLSTLFKLTKKAKDRGCSKLNDEETQCVKEISLRAIGKNEYIIQFLTAEAKLLEEDLIKSTTMVKEELKTE